MSVLRSHLVWMLGVISVCSLVHPGPSLHAFAAEHVQCQPALVWAGGRADGASTNIGADWATPWQAGPMGTVADFLALNT